MRSLRPRRTLVLLLGIALAAVGALEREVRRAAVEEVEPPPITSLCVEVRDRRGSDALVAASVGPYGAFLADGSEVVVRRGRLLA